MIGWIILGIILLILFLILIIPIGADFRYEDGVVRLSVKLAWMKLQLLPKKKKKESEVSAEKEEKKKKKKEKAPSEDEQSETKSSRKLSLPFNAEEIVSLLRSLLRCFGRFGRKFCVERFVLHWIEPSWNDPYLSARIFSVVNAAMSQLAPICSERFHCRNSSVWTDIDFARDEMFLEFGITITIRIGKIIGTAIEMAFAFLKILLRSKCRRKREEREEKRAMENWLREHPEDRVLLDNESSSLAS